MAYTLNTDDNGTTRVTVDLADIQTRYIQRSFAETWCHTVSGTPKGTITLTEEECTTSHALALKQYDEAKARLDSIKHVSSIFCEKWLEDSDFAQD
tara:strand:+ start:240 stop:527 length:288 start_codon:yes stop_codon:yes gene_type:complete